MNEATYKKAVVLLTAGIFGGKSRSEIIIELKNAGLNDYDITSLFEKMPTALNLVKNTTGKTMDKLGFEIHAENLCDDEKRV